MAVPCARPRESLPSAVWRLAHTLGEGAVEALQNLVENALELAVLRGGSPFADADLTGKVAIVTGGNAGIGFATARLLAQHGAHVVLACRDRQRAEAAAAAIASAPRLAPRRPRPHGTPPAAASAAPSAEAAATLTAAGATAVEPGSGSGVHAATASQPPPPPPLRVEAMQLDLSRLASVRAFADAWAARRLPLHLLLCNAGVMAPLQRTVTPDGLEVQLQVNFLSHWLLANLLVGRERSLRRQQQEERAANAVHGRRGSKPGHGGGGGGGDAPSCSDATRVVMVSSVVHRAGTIRWDDPLSERGYEPYLTYATTKLANVITAKELQRRFDRHPEYGLHDTAVAIHPALARTHLANNFFQSYPMAWGPRALQALWRALLSTAGQALLISPEAAARRVLRACVAPAEQVAGRYLALDRVYRPDKAADDPARADELWALATRLTSHTPHASLA